MLISCHVAVGELHRMWWISFGQVTSGRKPAPKHKNAKIDAWEKFWNLVRLSYFQCAHVCACANPSFSEIYFVDLRTRSCTSQLAEESQSPKFDFLEHVVSFVSSTQIAVVRVVSAKVMPWFGRTFDFQIRYSVYQPFIYFNSRKRVLAAIRGPLTLNPGTLIAPNAIYIESNTPQRCGNHPVKMMRQSLGRFGRGSGLYSDFQTLRGRKSEKPCSFCVACTKRSFAIQLQIVFVTVFMAFAILLETHWEAIASTEDQSLRKNRTSPAVSCRSGTHALHFMISEAVMALLRVFSLTFGKQSTTHHWQFRSAGSKTKDLFRHRIRHWTEQCHQSQ